MHLDKRQGTTVAGRDLNPFKGLLRIISVSSKLVKGPRLQKRKSCQVFVLVWASEGLSSANMTGQSDDKGEGRGVNSESRQFFRKELYTTFAIHSSVSGVNTYHTVCKYIYMHVSINTRELDSCFYKLWLLLLLQKLFYLRHFRSPGLIVFHVWLYRSWYRQARMLWLCVLWIDHFSCCCLLAAQS